jgi:hypothetical protein
MKVLTNILIPALLFAVAAPAPCAEPVDGEDRRALRHFLLVDCQVDGEEPALDALLVHAATLEAELGRLLVEGPAPSMLEEATAAAQNEWNRRAVFLANNEPPGLDADGLEIVLAITEQDYLDHARQRMERMVREKAVVALAAIDSPTARQTLRAAFGEADADLRRTIGAVFAQPIRAERGQPQLERNRAGVAGARR